MGRIKYICSSFISSFFGIRLLCFVLVQFLVIHNDLKEFLHFCQHVRCSPTPYVLLFLIQNFYFVMVYGLCCVYFFTEVPYMQSQQLYSIMRMGRIKWLWDKLLRIWITSFFLIVVETGLTVLLMLRNVKWSLDWGQVWYSLALTDATREYNMNISVPYQIINSYTPIQAMGKTLLLMFIVTGLIGTFMYVWSLFFSRNSAVILAGIFCVMTLVYINLGLELPFLSFLTPLEWMDLRLVDGQLSRLHPTFLGIVTAVILFFAGAAILATRKIKSMDIHLVNEE